MFKPRMDANKREWDARFVKSIRVHLCLFAVQIIRPQLGN